ncbi:MAG: hypothetical protein ABJO36_04775 [Litorimonas sp.]
MSLKYASLLKISVAGAVLLSVGACKPADKGQGALKSEVVSALNLSKSEAGVFAKYFATEECDVNEADALEALTGLGLVENGSNKLSFASQDFSGGLVTYRDVVVQDKDADADIFSAKTAVFHCPSLVDDVPGFARLDLTDAIVREDELTFTFGTLNISKPTSDAAAAIIDGMLGARDDGQDDIGFDAVSMTDVTLESDEISGSLDALSWGEVRGDNGQGKADLTIDNLDIVIPGQNDGQDMTLDFKGMSARNLNIGGKIDAQAAMSTNGVVGSVIGNLNAFQKPYDELVVETMKLDSEGFNVDFGGIEGQTTEKGEKIVTRQSLKPSVISLKPALADVPSFQRNYNIMKSLGFETLKFSGSSVTTLDSSDDSVSVSDGLFVVEDGFALNFEYSAEGLTEMMTALQEMTASNETPDPLAVYDQLKLRNFRLTLEDNSIVERGLKLASEMTGQSEKNIKRGLGMAVFAAAMAAQNEVQAEVYSETTEAFADFVKKGGTLTIEANPPAPFPLAPLLTEQGENIDPETLGFSASQEGGAE